MKKIIVATIVSCGFFIVGSLLLISTRDSKHTPTLMSAQNVVEDGPSCNNAEYLDTGNCEEATINSDALPPENIMSTKPLGPDEDFLVMSDGQTLHSILRPHGVTEQEIAFLSQALKPHLLARDLAAKDQYRFQLFDVEGGIRSIDHIVIRKIDPHRIPIVYRTIRTSKTAPTFAVSVKAPPVTEKVELIELSVHGTLYQTFNALPFGTELMQRLMGIFTWQMRMPKEVLLGDKIEMLVAKRFIYDEFIGYGRIDSAVYRQKGRTLSGYYFKSSDKKITGFFDENGRSIEREFSVSPVHETTATSNQQVRMHPVRKIRIRHNGIDFRGSIGTPFHSIADGTVIEKRFDVNVGNMIRVLHNYGVHSEYFHADSLVDDISVGQRVKRGQLLGTIGRTGRLCTGPHLHMGLYVMNGEKKRFIELSSLRNTLKPAPNITPQYAVEFSQHHKRMLAQIQQQKTIALRPNN